MSAEATILVAAIGNPDRGDDGVGPAVARHLRPGIPAGVELIDCAGNVLDLIEEWTGRDAVVLIDASEPQGEAGCIRRLDVTERALPADFAQNSTHSFGVAETVELARALGQLPRRLVVYLVEGERFSTGAPLSPRVEGAVAKAAQMILAEISAMGEKRV